MEQRTVHRLSTFIRQNIEPILAEWEAFARTARVDARITPAGCELLMWCHLMHGPSERVGDGCCVACRAHHNGHLFLRQLRGRGL